MTAPQALPALLAHQARQVQEYLVQRVPLVQGPVVQRVQRVQRVLVLRVLLAQLVPLAQEYLARQERRGLAQAARQEPRDHRDFLLASLTTKQTQRQQVAIQAMDLFCGIMLHKLMLHNYWSAT